MIFITDHRHLLSLYISCSVHTKIITADEGPQTKTSCIRVNICYDKLTYLVYNGISPFISCHVWSTLIATTLKQSETEVSDPAQCRVNTEQEGHKICWESQKQVTSVLQNAIE